MLLPLSAPAHPETPPPEIWRKAPSGHWHSKICEARAVLEATTPKTWRDRYHNSCVRTCVDDVCHLWMWCGWRWCMWHWCWSWLTWCWWCMWCRLSWYRWYRGCMWCRCRWFWWCSRSMRCCIDQKRSWIWQQIFGKKQLSRNFPEKHEWPGELQSNMIEHQKIETNFESLGFQNYLI